MLVRLLLLLLSFLVPCPPLQQPCPCESEDDNDNRAGNPNEKLAPAEQEEQLFKGVGGLGEGAEESDEHCASGDEDGAEQGVDGKGLAEDEGGADGVED